MTRVYGLNEILINLIINLFGTGMLDFYIIVLPQFFGRFTYDASSALLDGRHKSRGGLAKDVLGSNLFLGADRGT